MALYLALVVDRQQLTRISFEKSGMEKDLIIVCVLGVLQCSLLLGCDRGKTNVGTSSDLAHITERFTTNVANLGRRRTVPSGTEGFCLKSRICGDDNVVIVWADPWFKRTGFDKDIECGTVLEIENELRGLESPPVEFDFGEWYCQKLGDEDFSSIYNYRVAVHTEAVFLDDCLLVVTWIGDPRFTLLYYYDVRLRTYFPNEGHVAAAREKNLDDGDSTFRYTKRGDQMFKRVFDVVIVKAEGFYLRVGLVDKGGRSVLYSYSVSKDDGSLVPETSAYR